MKTGMRSLPFCRSGKVDAAPLRFPGIERKRDIFLNAYATGPGRGDIVISRTKTGNLRVKYPSGRTRVCVNEHRRAFDCKRRQNDENGKEGKRRDKQRKSPHRRIALFLIGEETNRQTRAGPGEAAKREILSRIIIRRFINVVSAISRRNCNHAAGIWNIADVGNL